MFPSGREMEKERDVEVNASYGQYSCFWVRQWVLGVYYYVIVYNITHIFSMYVCMYNYIHKYNYI